MLYSRTKLYYLQIKNGILSYQTPFPTYQNQPTYQSTDLHKFIQATFARIIHTSNIVSEGQLETNHYEALEKEWKSKEERRAQEIITIKKALSQVMKNMQSTWRVIGLEYEDLCMHPDLDLPEGYKVSKFDTFNNIGNPMPHLRVYCDKLVGVGENEVMLMMLFSQSLSGEALEWYISKDPRKWTA